MVDRTETEIALAALIESNQAVTDDQDRLLTRLAREGYAQDLGATLADIRQQRAALIAAMQTARTGLSVAVQP